VTSPASPPRRRHTANRQAVLDALLGTAETFRSAQQLFVEIREYRARRIALNSVYRILHGLAGAGITETQRSEDGEALYRMRRGDEHRHYLLCRRCGRAEPFAPKGIEEAALALIGRHGYTDVTHRIDFYGICPRCNTDASG
jgi:Fur family transcriptional regulator, ferric uptake regulator